MKVHAKAVVIVFIILITYTIIVVSYANKKKNTNKEDNNPVVQPTETPEPKTVQKEYPLNVILSTTTMLGYSDGVWEENPTYEYEHKDFDVYLDNNAYQHIRIIYDNSWHAMDPDRNFIDYEGDFTAIKSTIEYSRRNQDYVPLDATNEQVIKEFLDSKNITYNYDTLNKHVMIEDFNKDGIKDYIYVISNLFLDDYTGYDSTFAYVFVRSLNQNIMIFEDTYKAVNALSICNPYIDQFITVEDHLSLLLGCSYASAGGTKHMIYEMTGKTVNKVLETAAN